MANGPIRVTPPLPGRSRADGSPLHSPASSRQKTPPGRRAGPPPLGCTLAARQRRALAGRRPSVPDTGRRGLTRAAAALPRPGALLRPLQTIGTPRQGRACQVGAAEGRRKEGKKKTEGPRPLLSPRWHPRDRRRELPQLAAPPPHRGRAPRERRGTKPRLRPSPAQSRAPPAPQPRPRAGVSRHSASPARRPRPWRRSQPPAGRRHRRGCGARSPAPTCSVRAAWPHSEQPTDLGAHKSAKQRHVTSPRGSALAASGGTCRPHPAAGWAPPPPPPRDPGAPREV